MKTKYERMSKEEKKKLYSEYKKEKSQFVKKMNRMFILCYLGILYSISVFVYDFFFKDSTANSILDIIVLVFCGLSLLKMYSVKKNLLNAYVLNKNKKRRISEK